MGEQEAAGWFSVWWPVVATGLLSLAMTLISGLVRHHWQSEAWGIGATVALFLATAMGLGTAAGELTR